MLSLDDSFRIANLCYGYNTVNLYKYLMCAQKLTFNQLSPYNYA